MYDFLKTGEEVMFPGLRDIKLIVEECNDLKGSVRCKYYDDNLRRYIHIDLPAENLVPIRKNSQKKNISPIRRRTA